MRSSLVLTTALLVAPLALGACSRKEEKAEPAARPSKEIALRPTAPTPKPHTPPDAPALYKKYCALCHGEQRQGYAADNAPSLTSPTFLATVATDFLKAAIERGRPGTAMAAYSVRAAGPLTTEEIDALVSFILSGLPADQRVALPPTPVAGDAAAGKKVYAERCDSCHGNADQRRQALQLVNPALLATASDEYLRYATVHGRPGTPMKAWEQDLPAAAIDNVIAYLRSVAPKDRDLVPAAAPLGLERAPPPRGPVVINPRGRQANFTLTGDRLVSLAQVNQALAEKRRIVIVDARPPSEWLRLRIPGSISIPHYDLHGIDDLPKDGTWIIAYCACPHHASGVVVDELRKRKFPHTAVLDEGIFAWQRAGYPVEAAPDALPVPAPPPTVLDTIKAMHQDVARGTKALTPGHAKK